jgi:hypothetical protein
MTPPVGTVSAVEPTGTLVPGSSVLLAPGKDKGGT